MGPIESIKPIKAAPDAPKREWVYVPEVIEVDAKQYVAYENMQLAGDVFCYAVQGGDTEMAPKSIGRYSLTTRELKKSPIDFPEGGIGIWASIFLRRLRNCMPPQMSIRRITVP